MIDLACHVIHDFSENTSDWFMSVDFVVKPRLTKKDKMYWSRVLKFNFWPKQFYLFFGRTLNYQSNLCSFCLDWKLLH